MKQLIFSFFLLTSSICLFSQSNPAYDSNDYKTLVMRGLDMLETQAYDSCMIYFKKGFEIRQTSVLSTLRYAACAYSKGDTRVHETQFRKALELDWYLANTIFQNRKEFQYLKGTAFESQLNKAYEQTIISLGIDVALMTELELIGKSDQQYRKEMRGVSERHGWDSPQMDSLWALQNPIDSANTVRICQLIDEQGYPGKSIVGPGQAPTAFLVIQHADLDVQEKYLPTIIAAADADELKWRSVALLIDRVKVRNGHPQVYGTQVNTDNETGDYFFAEIEEPYRVDSLRAEIELGPLQKYADNWNFIWDPTKHIERHKKD